MLAVLLALASAPATAAMLQPRLALRGATSQPRAAALIMCDAASPAEAAVDVDALKQTIEGLEQQIEQTQLALKVVPDGPSRPEKQNAMRVEIAKLESDLAEYQATLEKIVGPPPKKYSAVARMRLKDGTMGDGAAAGGDDEGIDPASILPPMGGLVNAAVSLAVIGAVVFAFLPK